MTHDTEKGNHIKYVFSLQKQAKQKLKINLEKNNLNAYSGVLKDLTEAIEIFSLFFHLSVQFNNF